MKNSLIISSMLSGIILLTGCGQQPASQTQQSTTPSPVTQKPAEPLTNKQSDHQITPDEMKEIIANDSKETGKSTEQIELEMKKARIKSVMSSILTSATVCNDNKKTILSGNAGDKICERDSVFNSFGSESYVWPTIIDLCGPNPSDTKWVVKNGTESNWDITIDCKGFTDCNGPQNALCNGIDACKFSGSCK